MSNHDSSNRININIRYHSICPQRFKYFNFRFFYLHPTAATDLITFSAHSLYQRFVKIQVRVVCVLLEMFKEKHRKQ